MLAGPNGLPDPADRDAVRRTSGDPVDLEIGPGGDLFYVDLDGGTIRRIRYPAATARRPRSRRPSPTAAPLPLTVNFDGSGSSDPDAGDA